MSKTVKNKSVCTVVFFGKRVFFKIGKCLETDNDVTTMTNASDVSFVLKKRKNNEKSELRHVVDFNLNNLVQNLSEMEKNPLFFRFFR